MYAALFHKIYISGANLLIIMLDQLLKKIKEPSENERDALLEDRSFNYYKNFKRKDELAHYYSEYENDNDMRLVFDFTLSGLRPLKKNGISILADTSSKYYNIVNGHRVTKDTPLQFKNSIYIFGNCNAVGCHAEDKFTIASQLQKKYNDASPDTIRVVNHANWRGFEGTCSQIISPAYSFKRQDFVVILSHDVNQSKCESALADFQDKSFYAYCDLSAVFNRPHEYGEILLDNMHMTHRGYTILSGHIYNIINKLKKEKEKNQKFIPKDLMPYMNYLSMLKKKRGGVDGIIGSIVMNCNPFTLGHRFIILEALKRCDYLYIFILDEDKSFFKFDDRITMVKLGLQDFTNVAIVPSGKTIISSETMPEYFDKDSLQNIEIDTSYDLSLFSLTIAPALDITKRFAGMEPFCQITKQYNEGMRNILPQHGIEFVELPRFSVDGREISASLVRECIKKRDNEKIKTLVPPTTFEFLIEKHYI